MSDQVRASHFLIKHAQSRNPVSRRTDLSTTGKSMEQAQAEMARWREELEKDPRPMPEKFAALAYAHSDCGSFEAGGDLGWFGPGEMQQQFEEATLALEIGEVSKTSIESDSGTHIIFRTG